jgi:imidazolonepropionase-like amidohydrolase
MAVCPTVITFKVGTKIKTFQAGNFPRQEYISPMVLGIWASMWSQQDDLEDFIWQNWAQMVKGLHQAGVPLMVGTDLMVPGVFPGYAVHEEMAIWQEAGIPPADVLRSATLLPARFMGLGERLGSVSVGKAASLVLVRANPLEDIRNAQQIESVFLGGQFFSREDLARLLEEAKNLVAQAATGAG